MSPEDLRQRMIHELDATPDIELSLLELVEVYAAQQRRRGQHGLDTEWMIALARALDEMIEGRKS